MHMRKITLSNNEIKRLNLNKDKELKIIAKELKKLHSKKTYKILAKDFLEHNPNLKNENNH